MPANAGEAGVAQQQACHEPACQAEEDDAAARLHDSRRLVKKPPVQPRVLLVGADADTEGQIRNDPVHRGVAKRQGTGVPAEETEVGAGDVVGTVFLFADAAGGDAKGWR